MCLLPKHAASQRVHWDVHEQRDPLNSQYTGWVQQQLSQCHHVWVLKTLHLWQLLGFAHVPTMGVVWDLSHLGVNKEWAQGYALTQ